VVKISIAFILLSLRARARVSIRYRSGSGSGIKVRDQGSGRSELLGEAFHEFTLSHCESAFSSQATLNVLLSNSCKLRRHILLHRYRDFVRIHLDSLLEAGEKYVNELI